MSVAWDLTEGWTVHQVPSSLPPLFSGDRLVVYGLLKPSENAKQGMNKVRLQCTLGNGEKMEHFIIFSTPPIKNANFLDSETNSSVLLHCLAAKTFIKVKQDDVSDMWEIQREKSSIVSVSKSSNVVSKFTSFVAVDEESHQIVSGPLRKQFVTSFASQVMGFSQQRFTTVGVVDSACDSQLFGQPQVMGGSGFLCKGSSSMKKTPRLKSVARKKSPSVKLQSSTFVGGAPPPKPLLAAAVYGDEPLRATPLLFERALPHASLPPPSRKAALPSNLPKKEASCSLIGASRPVPTEKQTTVKKSIGSFFSKLFSGASLSLPKEKDQGQSSNAACALEEAERDNITKQEKEPEEDAPALLSVISLQKASGAWDLTDQLVSLCEKSRDSLITGCPAVIAVETSEGRLLWATALALALLMGKFGKKKDEWEMIAEKGKKWIRKNLPANVKDDEVLNFAAAAIGVQI